MNQKLINIADQIKKEGGFENSGEVYHPYPFPEFDQLSISSNPESAYKKWNKLKRYLNLEEDTQNLSVLDVGANGGFYTFNFAKRGAKVKAFEPHTHYVEIGRRIVDILDLNVEWKNKPIEKRDLVNDFYDVALMLSVFQWMSKGGENLEEATKMLQEISTRSETLIFELGCNEGKSALVTEERPITWVWRFLKKNTEYNNYHYLGTTRAWGKNKRYIFACTNVGKKNRLSIKQRLVTWLLEKRDSLIN